MIKKATYVFLPAKVFNIQDPKIVLSFSDQKNTEILQISLYAIFISLVYHFSDFLCNQLTKYLKS